MYSSQCLLTCMPAVRSRAEHSNKFKGTVMKRRLPKALVHDLAMGGRAVKTECRLTMKFLVQDHL